MWETPRLALDHIEEFLTGIHRTAEPRRVLATVLFTDIVNSTQQASRVDLRLRAGLHTGEVELRDNDVGGIAVHIAARVMAAARPGEILSSRTVRDLVVGSDVALESRGSRSLKGVEGRWQLFAVAER